MISASGISLSAGSSSGLTKGKSVATGKVFTGSLFTASGCGLTMVGLDVTLKPELPVSVFDRIRSAPGRPAEIVGRVLDFMMRRKDEFGADDPNLHDVIALASIVRPSLFSFENHYVHLETGGEVTRGMTIADINNVSKRPPNARVAVGIDVDGFWNWFVDLFGAGN